MIADRSNPVRTVSRTKWATCPEGTKSWIDGGSSQTWSTSQARNVLLIPRLKHDAPSSSRKIRLLGQAPSKAPVRHPSLTKGQVSKAMAILIALLFSKYVYLASFTSYYTFYLMDRFGLQ